MSFERNDVVFKNRLNEALEENTMGFEHNDIVTVDKMNAAIAGGGGGDLSKIFPTEIYITINASGLIAETKFCDVYNQQDILLYDNGEDRYSIASTTQGLIINNGENKLVGLLTLEADGGLDLEPPFDVFEISVSGDAAIEEEDDFKWISITGDCTITVAMKE